MGDWKVCIGLALGDLQSHQFSRHTERLLSIADEAIKPQLARVGAAVDLAIEEHIARFDAQAVGRSPAALAQPANIQQLLAQRQGFGSGDHQLVAELTAETEPRGYQVVYLNKVKVFQCLDRLAADKAREDASAGWALEGEDRVFARAVAAAEGAAAPGEEPEALAVQAPYRRVDENAAVVFQEKRVGDLPGCECIEVACLKRLNFGLPSELVKAHEREVEQARCTAGGEMLFARVHSERRSRKPPLATQRPPARRRSARALATCARRTPTIKPASSKMVTSAATRKSMNPWRRLPSEPELAAMICSPWLVATAASGT